MNHRVIEDENYWQVKCTATGRIVIPKDGRWDFNGDLFNPTFSPSVKESWGPLEAPNQNINHVQISQGTVHYYEDCTHLMKGQTEELLYLSDAEEEMYYGE